MCRLSVAGNPPNKDTKKNVRTTPAARTYPLRTYALSRKNGRGAIPHKNRSPKGTPPTPPLRAAFYASLEARMCSGCSHGFEVDISICHLQVSQSVATMSAPEASICRNSGAPMACEVA